MSSSTDEFLNVPVELIQKIGLDLDLWEIYSLCLTSKTFNNAVCNDDLFWKEKIQRFYPFLTDYKQPNESYREQYEWWVLSSENTTEFEAARNGRFDVVVFLEHVNDGLDRSEINTFYKGAIVGPEIWLTKYGSG